MIISEEAIIQKVTEYKDKEYDKLSKLFEENIDISKIKEIIKLKN